MDATEIARVITICTFLFIQLTQVHSQAYEIPPVTIQALSPRGIRVSIPDSTNLSLFAFQGNVNKGIANSDVGSISGEVLQSTDGRWVFEDPTVQLKIGDVINYYVFVSVNSAGFIKDKLTYTVTALDSPSSVPSVPTPSVPTRPQPGTPAPSQCRPTLTKIRGGTACAGQTIFEENFNTLQEDVWQIEQYIPVDHPEFPFVSYQRLTSNATVWVMNGNLHIAPRLQQSQPGFNADSIYSGNLNLFSGCTGSAKECSAQAWGASILPPVVSGRLTSKGFAFTYGTVHVRAKLPQGDWLYPEILLEPFLKKYGNLNYASGVIKIACARGNRELNVGVADYGNAVLYGGPIMDVTCREYLLNDKKLVNGKRWGDDFHVYSVKWSPEKISLLVDFEEWAHIYPATGGLRGHFPPHCRDLPQNLLATRSGVAPFDDHFYLTLGVVAGGITEFRDDMYTRGNIPKPWTNRGRKASLNFWQDMDNWLPTWSNSELLVDYVKVVAL